MFFYFTPFMPLLRYPYFASKYCRRLFPQVLPPPLFIYNVETEEGKENFSDLRKKEEGGKRKRW